MASRNMSRMLVAPTPAPRIQTKGPMPRPNVVDPGFNITPQQGQQIMNQAPTVNGTGGGFTRVSPGVYRGPNGQLTHSTQNPTSLATPMQPKPAMPPQAPIGANGPNAMGGVFGQASPQPAPTYGQNPWAQFGSPNAGAMRLQYNIQPNMNQNINQMQPLFAQGGGQAGQYDPSSGNMAAANGATNAAVNQLAGPSPMAGMQGPQSIPGQGNQMNPQFQTTGNV